jgi:hypothetical protein
MFGFVEFRHRMMEEATFISRDCNRICDVHDLAAGGAHLYRQHGYPESAVYLLKRSAKMLEKNDEPAAAASLWEKAAETVMGEDRIKEAGEYMAKSARLAVKGGNYAKAAVTLDQSLSLMHRAGWGSTTGRSVLGLVLLQLAIGDPVAASKAFQAWGGYCDPDQTFTCYQLVNGFNDGDSGTYGQTRVGIAFRSTLSLFDVSFRKFIV